MIDIVLVIDVPSTDYLADLERNELLNGHLNEINSQLGMEFVAHFTSSKLIETSMYQQFMRRINAKRHLAVNDLNLYDLLTIIFACKRITLIRFLCI